MINFLRKMFKPSLDEKIFILECNKNTLIKEIRSGRKKFLDNDKMIEFSTLLTAKLVTNYKVNGGLTDFEEIVLDKALKDGIYRISFLLLSDIEKSVYSDEVIKKLISEGFKLIENVGYVNIDKVIHHIVVPHSFE